MGEAADDERRAEPMQQPGRRALQLGQRHQHQGEHDDEAEHGELAPLHLTRAVRDDAELQAATAQLVYCLRRVGARAAVVVEPLPEMREQALGERSLEPPGLHELRIALFFRAVPMIVHRVHVAQEAVA